MNYHETRTDYYNRRLRGLLAELPPFCELYFSSQTFSLNPLTRFVYAMGYRHFFDWLLDRPDFYVKDIRQFTHTDLENVPIKIYTDYVTSRNIKTETMAGDIIRLRSLFTYLYKNRIIEKNITDLLIVPKIKQKPIIHLSKKEVEKVMKLTDKDFLTAGLTWIAETKVRDDAIMAMFLYTGVRISELAGLNFEDVDLNEKSFYVTRKGGDIEKLYLSEVPFKYLLKYIEEDRPKYCEPLFRSTRQRKRLHPVTIRLRVKEYMNVAGIDNKRITPHKLRATYGTHLYGQTDDIYLVANCLGHKNVQTTARYYANLPEKKRRSAMVSFNY